ncbi:prohibitin family protein [Paracraurococcus lichenis]|uniref:Prohibitin family protein n=1 Tax=Paracraurococcus lichenis TaxID=3064888 RepID=A0ABT9E956_9PROT|nr:prohibitin family protein [Paracraurococcus sp. LOR1-02]MDO9712720.1 prohibitin family protein [Paracraurococcus sp. LOR1-02]
MSATSLNSTIIDAAAPRRPWYSVMDLRRSVLIVLMIAMMVFFYFLPSIVIFIPAGHGGVLWKRFDGGTQMTPALPEGVHLAFPWDRIEIYDLRLSEDTRVYTAIANDGLPVDVEITVRYRPYAETLAQLHKNVGPDYLNVLLIPEVGSVSREIISRVKADELYAHRRLRVQVEAFEQLADKIMQSRIVGTNPTPGPGQQSGYLLIHDVLIREVRLPDVVVGSIEKKIQQDQAAQEYQFRLQREIFESQRKQIEAQGIRAFQETVQSNLTDAYLRWRGLEATLNLANSNNSKVVVIGNSQTGGMPLILDTKGEPEQPAKPADAAPSPAPANSQQNPPAAKGQPTASLRQPAAETQAAQVPDRGVEPPLPAATILKQTLAPLRNALR